MCRKRLVFRGTWDAYRKGLAASVFTLVAIVQLNRPCDRYQDRIYKTDLEMSASGFEQ